MFTLSSHQLELAEHISSRAHTFALTRGATLPAAMINGSWRDGDSADVVTALAAYQNPDGGFGKRLEPDIHAPESNPFAARLAMQVMRAFPDADFGTTQSDLATWLRENQAGDGDWHFSDATKAGFLQPWFAGWTFPSLNPACCLAGLAADIGMATPEMMTRVADLFAATASPEAVRSGGFYDVLPYVEYSLGVQLDDVYLDAISANITATGDAFEDGSHFFDLAMGGSPEITTRIPEELVNRWVDRLLQEPQADGGWPTPYDDAWRSWTTASNLIMLARLGQ